ncbi:DNA-directed RNA polymerase [Quaeritorhiza haematococci]|nr:DNA-directed RNA polymerase [Quaeritorhiza haematococci]
MRPSPSPSLPPSRSSTPKPTLLRKSQSGTISNKHLIPALFPRTHHAKNSQAKGSNQSKSNPAANASASTKSSSNSSTTSSTTGSSSTSTTPYVPSHHVLAPDIFEERLAMINACLLNKEELTRAEILFHRLWRTNLVDMRKYVDIKVFNAFIDAYLEPSVAEQQLEGNKDQSDVLDPANTPHRAQATYNVGARISDIDRALEWYERIYEYGLKPTEKTFAILLSHFTKAKDVERCQQLLHDMLHRVQGDSLNPTEVLGDSLFADADDRSALEALMRAQGIDVDGYSPADDLLLAAMEDSSGAPSARKPKPVGEKKEGDVKETVRAIEVENETSKRSGSNDLLGLMTGQRNPTIIPSASSKTRYYSGTGDVESLGVRLLQRTLAKMDASPYLADKRAQQEFLERECLQMALDFDSETQQRMPEHLQNTFLLGNNAFGHTVAGEVNVLVNKWYTAMLPHIKRELAHIRQSSKLDDAETNSYGPFMLLVKPEQMALITIAEFLKAPSKREMEQDKISFGELRATKLLLDIGKGIEQEAKARYIKSKKGKKLIQYEEGIHALHDKGKLNNSIIRKLAMSMARKETEKDEKWMPEWPPTVHVKIGSILASILIRCAKIHVLPKQPRQGRQPQLAGPEETTTDVATSADSPAADVEAKGVQQQVEQQEGPTSTSAASNASPTPSSNVSTSETSPIPEEPAFYHTLEHHGRKAVGFIKYNRRLSLLLLNNDRKVIPRYLPMVVKPRPWIRWDRGGYLTTPVHMARTHGGVQHKRFIARADNQGHLDQVREALDVLGETPWKINQPILEVIEWCWEEGSAWPSMVTKSPIRLPEKPKDFDQSAAKRFEWKREAMKKLNEEKNRHSQRCDVSYKIQIARAFKSQTIYFPHYIDFRGRAYPIPVYLNHVGNDLCRALLLFDEAKPLGERGLRWLKIQIASLYGVDKVSFAERERFVDEHLDEVYDSADKPLEGRRWWLNADSPWQCLAACIELAAALRSPIPENYMSSLPIHQDGTCNGLQHYAALGGDLIGAQLVNLAPSDKPSDVYTSVADRVRDRVRMDARTRGLEPAVLMQDRITRKLVKQTVMTNTYGVTYVGARAQVSNRLKETVAEHNMSDSEMFKCASYITTQIFDSLGELFEGARAIQNWLNTTAKMVASSVPDQDLTDTQLRDAMFLQELGVLPTPQAIARRELNRRRVDEPAEQKDVEDVVDMRSTSEAAEASTEKTQPQKVTSQGAADVDTHGLLEPEKNLLKSAGILDVMGHDHGVDIDMVADDDFAADASSKSASSSSSSSSMTVEDPSERVEGEPFTKKADPVKMTSVIWTSPLGLPIVQPYRNFRSKMVKTNLQHIALLDTTTPSPVDSQKQSTAFPPNFIHSLDASHMMLSAISCKKAGLQFAAVHDSYWTHASDVDTMNRILREAFVRLHSQDVMMNLKNELMTRYRGYKYPVTVELSGEKLVRWMMYLRKTGRVKDAMVEAAIEGAKASGVTLPPSLLTTTTISAAEEQKPKSTKSSSLSASSKTPSPTDTTSTEDPQAKTHHGRTGKKAASTSRKPKTPVKPKLMTKRVVASWVDLEIPQLPPKGTFDVKTVFDSPYFFH